MALLRAAVVEDQQVIGYLLDEEITGDTFVELLTISAGAMEYAHGQDHAVQIIDGWLNRALDEVDS